MMMQTLSRGADHLGFIEATLRSLKGFGTLANELIQNADDAPEATGIVFDIRDEAFVVENNGLFSDCGHQELQHCPWFVDPETDSRCDFHSFRSVASGDKRNRAGTTGAFGIGFIAVYQVTDHPEVISRGRHWIVRDELSDNERIAICPGCDQDSAEGTRFILPWARDPSTFLRRRLRASAITDSVLDDIEREVVGALATGILFLSKLDVLELRRRGVTVRHLERLVDDDRILVKDGEEREWLVIRGDFDEAADAIRVAVPDQIERKRSSRVTLAVPRGFAVEGILAQGLPTQQTTGLPFHINADFFPTSDRKKVVLESDFQGDWNRAAIKAAAAAFARSLIPVRDALGYLETWKTVDAIRSSATMGRQDDVARVFWDLLLPALAEAPIAWGIDGQWHRLGEVLRAQQDEEADAEQELLALGITLLHRDLRPYSFSIPGSTGIRTLSVMDLAAALRGLGMCGLTATSAVPSELRPTVAMERLWKAIDQLLEPKRATTDARTAIGECALLPVIGGGLVSAATAVVGDPATAAMFLHFTNLAFVDTATFGSASPRLLDLCKTLGVEEAIRGLEASSDSLMAAYRDGRLEPRGLLQWFATRQDDVLPFASLRARLAALPIYPGGGRLAPLAELAMVGNFDDPLGLTEFVDLNVLHGLRGFLSDLGVGTLDLRTYILRLPDKVEALGDAFEAPHRAQILRLLADRLGELRDDEPVRLAVKSICLANVGDRYIPADQAYFDTAAVRETLGDTAQIIRLTPGHETADRDLLEWLGARSAPRRADLRRRIAQLTSDPPTEAAARAIRRIFDYVGNQSEESGLWEGLSDLKRVPWLPAEGNRTKWFGPSEIYAGFSKSLFASQAAFLDVPLPIQRKIADYLRWLGVESQPTTSQVVSHLLWLIESGAAVPSNIYQTLNDDAKDPSLHRLEGIPCLKFVDEAYRADQVFWGEHGLSPYAHRLGQDLRQYGTLMERLGVKEMPDNIDALRVLKELAESVGHRRLSHEQVDLALSCWRVIERDRDEGKIDEAWLANLHAQPSVPTSTLVLERPDWLFFEDRPGLSAKFGATLKASIIDRPEGAWRAMRAAGIRDLGRVVRLNVIEQTDPRHGSEVEDRIRERRDLLERVIEVHARAAGEVNRTLLDSLTPYEVDDLVLQYSVALDGGTRVIESLPETASAAYVETEGNLYYLADHGIPPWSALARELAIGLFPTLEPGGPASGFRDVLTSSSHAAASAVLDELAYPRLVSHNVGSSAEEPLEGLGSEEIQIDETAAAPEGAPSPDAYEPETQRTRVGTGSGSEDQTAGEPAGTEGDEHAQDGFVGSRGSDWQSGGTGGAPSDGQSKQHRQSRLRTYVVPEGAAGADHDGQLDEALAARRTVIEEAGIRRVVEAEEKAGWTPEVMPPGNPGFDIRSLSPIGDVRLIEVKATAVEWGEQGVAVSHRQFLTSLDEEDRFWLYVVERADDDINFRVYRIFNPGGRVDQFIFDGGWRGADAGPEPAAAAGVAAVTSPEQGIEA